MKANMRKNKLIKAVMVVVGLTVAHACACIDDLAAVGSGIYLLESYETGTSPDFPFDPAWFPMASTSEVSMNVDRKTNIVTFEYMMGATRVTERWKVVDVFHADPECSGRL